MHCLLLLWFKWLAPGSARGTSTFAAFMPICAAPQEHAKSLNSNDFLATYGKTNGACFCFSARTARLVAGSPHTPWQRSAAGADFG
jgi:hypothetical protein